MKDDLFNTEEKRQSAIATFTTGVDTSFWRLMKQILEANIEVLTKQILDGGVGTTKGQMDRLRDKLVIYREIVDTPSNMIKKLTVSDGEEPNLDPFPVGEEPEDEVTGSTGDSG